MRAKFKLTPEGKKEVKRKVRKVLAVFDDTNLSLQVMSSKPTKAWTAKDLHNEIGGGIPPADVPFFRRRLEELQKKGFVEIIQPTTKSRSSRQVPLRRSKALRITPKTPRLRR